MKKIEKLKKGIVDKFFDEKKTFLVCWVDEVNKSIEIEAKDEEEAKKMFYSGEIDFGKAEEGDVNLNEYSLQVEEVD